MSSYLLPSNEDDSFSLSQTTGRKSIPVDNKLGLFSKGVNFNSFQKRSVLPTLLVPLEAKMIESTS